MPGLTVPRRRNREPDDSEEEDVSDSAASSSRSSGGSKRARLDHDAFSDESGSSVLPDSYRNQLLDQDGNYDTDPHQPGAIVRVKLTNFVTYTAAEFLPGPSLNMIIGPNGTGKSTLVCAICLGLGWSAANLGRAKDPAEYIKHGEREAEIEIELAGGPHTKNKNVIIRRIIKREGSKTLFSINGRASNQKAVVAMARSFSIQIDNLCQFLPQDRVVEFAQMTPVEKLGETQRAVASSEVVQMHETLIEYRGEQKKAQHDQKQKQDYLSNLTKRHNAQRADVERMQERQSLVTREKALRSMRPFIEYRHARQEVEDAKQAKMEAKANLQRLQREVEPSLRAVNAKQAYRDQIKEVVNNRKRMVQLKEKSADDFTTKLEKSDARVKQAEGDIEGEKRLDQAKREKVIQFQRKITGIQAQMEDAPPSFDSVQCNKEIREKAARQRVIQDEVRDMKDKQKDLHRNRVDHLVPRRTRAHQELQDLSSQSGQQINKLRNKSADTARAWEWIQRNGDRFEGEIHGPPVVTCSVRDPRYADGIESMIQNSESLAFTCTNNSDFKALQDELLDKLKLHDISIRLVTRRLDQWQRPVSDEELRRLGFEGWLIDFVDGPESVLAMLCDNANLHRTAVTREPDTEEQFNKLVDSQIQTWVAGRKSFRILRRKELGASAVQTRVNPLRKATIWTDQPIDIGAERDIRARIGEIEMQMEEEKRQFEEYNALIQPKRDEIVNLETEKKALEKEKSDAQRLQSRFSQLPIDLAEAESAMKNVEDTRAGMRERIASSKTAIKELQLEKGRMILDYANSIEHLRLACVALMEAEILHIEASSEFDALATEARDIKEMLEDTIRVEKEMVERHKRLFEHAKKLGKKCAEVHNNRTEEEANIHEENSGIATMEELESEIESVATRLELMTDGNPRAIQEYEERAEQISRTEAKLEDLNQILEEMQGKITDIRARWEPQIDALVERISEGFSRNFEKIGCAGQVQIDKHEDFDQWSIEILVRFRENEEMAILDSHRQSGGERAVSTIFYLMALQDMARSPFRVVDEINQGMDPRNERMVHERMVDIACKERTSQYFLVTPKLLNGLKYHPKMKVHCIASGEYMPSDYNDLDTRSLLDIAVRVKGQA